MNNPDKRTGEIMWPDNLAGCGHYTNLSKLFPIEQCSNCENPKKLADTYGITFKETLELLEKTKGFHTSDPKSKITAHMNIIQIATAIPHTTRQLESDPFFTPERLKQLQDRLREINEE